jgi:hypothetical protein
MKSTKYEPPHLIPFQPFVTYLFYLLVAFLTTRSLAPWQNAERPIGNDVDGISCGLLWGLEKPKYKTFYSGHYASRPKFRTGARHTDARGATACATSHGLPPCINPNFTINNTQPLLLPMAETKVHRIWLRFCRLHTVRFNTHLTTKPYGGENTSLSRTVSRSTLPRKGTLKTSENATASILYKQNIFATYNKNTPRQFITIYQQSLATEFCTAAPNICGVPQYGTFFVSPL